MKKVSKNKRDARGQRSPEKACVGGSIPSLGTIFKIPRTLQLLEIPSGWEVVPAVRWVRGVPKHYRVLQRIPRKRWGRGGDSIRRSRSA
jgi:hypothetical protein